MAKALEDITTRGLPTFWFLFHKTPKCLKCYNVMGKICSAAIWREQAGHLCVIRASRIDISPT